MNRLAHRWAATLSGACLAIAGAAFAQTLPPAGPLPWNELGPAQRGVLAPLERDWKTISPSQQQKWAEIAKRFPALPPEERGRVQQRLSDWSRLSPTERAAARLNYQEARQLRAIHAWGRQAPADLSAIRQPVLVANGDADKMVPSGNSTDLARRLPNAELVLYDDAGHGGMFQYHAAFVKKALAFLA